MSNQASLSISSQEKAVIRLHYLLARAYLSLDKGWQALKSLLSLFLFRTKTSRFINAAEIYEMQGEPALAVEHYLKALARSANRALPHLGLGRCYLRLVELEKSRENIDWYLTRKPDDPEGNLYKGILLYYSGDYRAALDHLKKAEGLLPAKHKKTASALEYIGECFRKLSEYPEAIRYMEASLDLDPYNRNFRTFMSLGELHFVTGNREKALNFYLAALKLNPENPEIWNDLGVVFHNMGEKEKAIDCFIQAVAIKPGFSEATANLKAVRAELGLSETSERVRKVEKATPNVNTRWCQSAKVNRELSKRFCESPWVYTEIHTGGGVFVCCPVWSGNKPIGNIFQNSPEEIWNSNQAQLIRAGVLNGTFDQCDKNKCPRIIGGALPRRDNLQNENWGSEIQRIIDRSIVQMDRGPRVVRLGYDSSCNLWCPSCRNKLIVAKKEEQKRLDQILNTFIVPYLKQADTLVLSGDGDPFASKHYRDIMKITKKMYPQLKLGLHTNGVLFDEKAWIDCQLEGRVKLVQVSIDAAEPETYANVRRGGDFKRLMRNLEFLAELRKVGKIKRFDLLFVVQTINYLEMPDFIRLGKRLGVDSVQFMLIDHWERGLSYEEYVESKIWDKRHRHYADLIQLLRDPIFDDPIVHLDSVQALREDWQPPEIQIDAETGEHRRSA